MALTREAGFGAEVKRRIMLGTYALSSGLLRRLLRQGPAGSHADHPGLRRRLRAGRRAGLARPRRPRRSRIGERADDPMAMYLADLCTIPSDLAGNAAISVPCGLAAEDGLPVGLQVMAPALADDRMYRVAAAAEAALTDRWGAAAASPRRRGSHDDEDGQLVPFAEAVQRYEPVIGLETHVELGTRTKMFCGCPTTFGAEPNSQVCPVCLGLPGSLPVVNRTSIEYTIRIGLALNCSIATWCRFARKNYFYPDMPKDFQISPVRRAAVHRWLARRRGRGPDLPGGHRAGAPGGGHRQVAAHGRRDRPDPRCRLLACRLQPGRHPAGRGRDQAGDGTGAPRRPSPALT